MLALATALHLAAAALSPAPAAGSTPQAPLTLDGALAILRERGFDHLLADLQLEAARGDARAASASANPQLSGGIGHSFGFDPSACEGCSTTAFSIGLSDQAALWDLVIGKKGLRGDAARAAVLAAEHSRDGALRALELQLKQAFVQTLLAARQEELASEVGAAADRILDVDRKRRTAGAIGEAELARVEVQALQTWQQRDQAHAQLEAARATLGLILGGAPEADGPLDPAGLEYALPAPLAKVDAATLAADALTVRPELASAKAQVQRAAAAADLARRQRIPDLALSLGYAQQGTGQSAITPPTLSLGLSLPIPLLYQQQGEITRAEADARSQTIALSRMQAQVTSEVRSSYAAFTAARSRVTRAQDSLLARSRRVRELVEIQWSKGAASVLDLLDAQRTWLSIENDHLQDLAAYWTAVAQLEAAVGKDLRQ